MERKEMYLPDNAPLVTVVKHGIRLFVPMGPNQRYNRMGNINHTEEEIAEMYSSSIRDVEHGMWNKH